PPFRSVLVGLSVWHAIESGRLNFRGAPRRAVPQRGRPRRSRRRPHRRLPPHGGNPRGPRRRARSRRASTAWPSVSGSASADTTMRPAPRRLAEGRGAGGSSRLVVGRPVRFQERPYGRGRDRLGVLSSEADEGADVGGGVVAARL